jgi:acid stress-induced BolA-like protein IbaG/YrbA
MCTVRILEANDPSRLERAKAVAQNLNGVTKSEADHAVQMLTAEYDPERTTLKAIRNEVRRV